MKKNISMGFFVMAFLFLFFPAISSATNVSYVFFGFPEQLPGAVMGNEVESFQINLNGNNGTHTLSHYSWTYVHQVVRYGIKNNCTGAITYVDVPQGENYAYSTSGTSQLCCPAGQFDIGGTCGTCPVSTVYNSSTKTCNACTGQTVFMTDPARCEPVICNPPNIWDDALKTCNPPPTCDQLEQTCIGECVAVARSDMDFKCFEDPTTGNQISTCNCVPPAPEVTTTVIPPKDDATPEPTKAPAPAPETPPAPVTNEYSAVLDNIARNTASNANRMDMTNGYLENLDINGAKTVNNLDVINRNMGTIGDQTNGYLKGISDRLSSLTNPKPPTLGGSVTVPADNVYVTDLDPIEEVNGGLVSHITEFIASGIPILGTIRNSKIIASGTSTISQTFWGKPFTVNFADYSDYFNIAGTILVFAATVAGFYIVSGKK